MFVYYSIEPYTDMVIIGGQRMAQTRRMGKRNQRADLPKAPRFSPYRSGLLPCGADFVNPPIRAETSPGRAELASQHKTSRKQGY
jgi:hypothetical protein